MAGINYKILRTVMELGCSEYMEVFWPEGTKPGKWKVTFKDTRGKRIRRPRISAKTGYLRARKISSLLDYRKWNYIIPSTEENMLVTALAIFRSEGDNIKEYITNQIFKGYFQVPAYDQALIPGITDKKNSYSTATSSDRVASVKEAFESQLEKYDKEVAETLSGAADELKILLDSKKIISNHTFEKLIESIYRKSSRVTTRLSR